MANPPFAGSLDYESCAKDLQLVVKTKKTKLLFLALFLRLLKPGGRAAVIVPDGVLFGNFSPTIPIVPVTGVGFATCRHSVADGRPRSSN
jgi:hypothetical protein